MDIGDYSTISKFKVAILDELKKYFDDFEFEVVVMHGSALLIDGTKKNEASNNFHLIRINLINDFEAKEIQIPTIFLPDELKYKGIGKKIISLVYSISIENQYRLFICDLVQSFYNKLVGRGATIIRPYDVVEITADTDLT